MLDSVIPNGGLCRRLLPIGRGRHIDDLMMTVVAGLHSQRPLQNHSPCDWSPASYRFNGQGFCVSFPAFGRGRISNASNAAPFFILGSSYP